MLEGTGRILESYIDDPSEENIHDVRISIRRLEAAYLLLPRRAKTKKSDKIVLMCGDFFTANSAIRDQDIILGKLDAYGYDRQSRASLITQRKKLRLLSKVLNLAYKISKTKKAKLKRHKSARNRFQRKTFALIRDFEDHVPVVASGEDHVKELHSMRKTVKKLRYVLELHPGNKYEGLVANLKLLQGVLGTIHDCDVFARYLKKTKELPGASDILAVEQEKRSAAYKQLAHALTATI